MTPLAQPRKVTDLDQVRAAFLRTSTALPPVLPEAGLRAALLRRLDHDVVRNRVALILHVQRLLLYLQEQDADGAWGALLDMFIVLGERGRDLRQSMVHRASPLLGAQRIAFFEAHLEGGIGEFDVLPDVSSSRLSRGLCGHLSLVSRSDKDVPTAQDQFELAEQCLHDGQVTEAVVLLEGLVKAAPARMEVTQLLLDVYRRGQFKHRLFALLPHMSDAPDEVREAWRACARELDCAQEAGS
jgi:hypothetical protein